MKKLISFVLVLSMAVSMAACGCDHQWQEANCTTPKTCTKCGETEGTALAHVPGDPVITAVDVKTLTVTCDVPCSVCGQVMEARTGSTSEAPVNGVIAISPEEWYNCLVTNIHACGAGQSIYAYPAESQDGTLLHGLVSMSQMMAVFSYLDADGSPITTEENENRGSIHNIRMDAQFTNDNAKEFFMLLMIIAINNNSTLEPEAANTMAAEIMRGHEVTDNGYTYAMEIISAEEHRVCVSITAE